MRSSSAAFSRTASPARKSSPLADLTPREQQVYDLRHSTDPLMTFRAIARQLGFSYERARNAYHKAVDKMDPDRAPDAAMDVDAGKVEWTDPDKAVEGIDALTDPLISSVAAAARSTGLPESTMHGLNKRLQRDYQGVYEEVTKIKSDVFIKALERNTMAALEAITPEKYAEASAYHLTLMAAISLDKKLVVEGKPTQNFSLTLDDRRAMPAVMAAVLRVAESRGYMKIVDPETSEVTLGEREDAPVEVLLHRSSKVWMDPIDHENEL